MDDSRLDRGMATFPRGARLGKEVEERNTEDTAGLTAEAIDTGDVADNLRHLLPLVCVSDGKYSTSKRVKYLNDLAKVIKRADHVIEPNYPVERIIECARLSLLSTIKEIRAGGLRVLRYLLTSREAFAVMLKHCIDLLVARSLDAPPNREIERLQAVRFVRQALALSPEHFPRSLVTPLVSILLSASEPQDNLTWSCMATLCEIALHYPELAARTSTIKALVKGLLRCHTSRISESVILTLSHLLNSPLSRKYICSQFDIESLLAPITDLHYCHQPVEASTSTGESSRANSSRVEASKMALVSLLKCWPGIFCLCNQRNLGMTSLLNMLPLAKPDVQREILDVLFGVFQLKVPEWTSSFNQAIASIDPSQAKNEWSLMEGFVAEEGNDLLPPKSVDRTNLIDCYQALILAALIQEGLFHVLVETVRTADRHVIVMATILMAELLHLTNIILPPGYSSDAHTLPDLIASAMDFQDLQDQRNRASEVISCLDRVHQMKKGGVKPSSLYLKLILEQSGYFVSKKEDLNLKELDEVSMANLIKESNVLQTKEYAKWNWGLLFSFLQHPSLKTTHISEDALFARFIKRLCNFYKPSNHVYSSITYSESNSKCYSSVGLKLVKYLCRAEEGGLKYLFDLVTDVVAELCQVTASKLTADVFSNTSISHKMARDYFLFLGTISFHKPSLLVQCKAYGPLLDICNYQNRCDLMKLMLSSLDFAHDIHSQVILGKILTSTDKEMRQYATKHLRVLLRAKMPFFNSWGLELLISQLYDTDKVVAIEAADILDEACEEDSFLKALVLQQPQLLHLGEKGAAIQTRFFSVKRGFALMSRLGYLDDVQERWSKSVNKLYVYIVEEKLAESLTSFKHVQDMEFIRRTSTNVINPKAFVPVHLYGQLAQHVEGCALLEKENYVPQFARVISMDTSAVSSHDDIITFKAAIWALGHIGSASGGLDLLIREEVVDSLVALAETCPVLSIRGTAYYALCLISKTSLGAELLMEHNWTTVCHSLAEKWPLAFNEVPMTMDTVFAASPINSPLKTPGLQPFPRAPSERGHKKRTTQSVSNLIDSSKLHESVKPSSSPSLIKYHSTATDSPSSGVRYRSPSSRSSAHLSMARKAKANTTNRSRPSALPMQTRGGVAKRVRPNSTVSGDFFIASQHSRSYSGVSTQSFSLRQSLSSSSVPYLGVCLPLHITKMFEYDEPMYEGFITESVSAPNFDKDSIPHNPYKCLECSIPLNKAHHQSQSDISVSNENLTFTNLPHTGGSNSLSPVIRSRSHTLESTISSSESNSTTPRSQTSSKGSPKPSSNLGTSKSEHRENGEVKPRDLREAELSMDDKKPKSPLVRMKRVISESAIVEESGSKSSGEGTDSKVLSPGAGSSTSGEVMVEGKGEEEEGDSKGTQEVMINVIGASVSAATKEHKVKRQVSQRDSSSAKDSSETGSLSSLSLASTAADNTNKLHQAYLEVVYGLSSDVSLKKNSMTLNMFAQKYPDLSQDVCLYSKVVDLLSTYNYKLNTRRFIQSKFDKLNFSTIFAARPQLDEEFSEDDFLSSACSSRRDSVSSLDIDIISMGTAGLGPRHQMRRRSSTSDATKFREKLQILSQSVERQENLVAESPREGDTETEEEEGEKEESVDSAGLSSDKASSDTEMCELRDVRQNSEVDGGTTQAKKDDDRTCNSNANNNRMTGKRNGDIGGRGRLGVLPNQEGERTGSDVVPASVVNVGFDL